VNSDLELLPLHLIALIHSQKVKEVVKEGVKEVVKGVVKEAVKEVVKARDQMNELTRIIRRMRLPSTTCQRRNQLNMYVHSLVLLCCVTQEMFLTLVSLQPTEAPVKVPTKAPTKAPTTAVPTKETSIPTYAPSFDNDTPAPTHERK
jgi:hypothetical protein